MKAEEVNINSKVMELRSEVSQRTKVPAHAGNRLRKALPNKVQLNGRPTQPYKVTVDWNYQEWDNNELILEISLKNVWQEFLLKKHELEKLTQHTKRKMLT